MGVTENSQLIASRDAREAREALAQLRALRTSVLDQAEQQVERWRPRMLRTEFQGSALNLAAYVALRRVDLRQLQDTLTFLGLSSLGRLEGRVIANLDAVIAALSAILEEPERPPFPERGEMLYGQHALHANSDELFGPCNSERQVRLMVTLPADAATDGAFVEQLVRGGMDVARINCAHHDAKAWQAMIDRVRAAARSAARNVKVLMDIAGPKCRTDSVKTDKGHSRLRQGDRLYLARDGFLPLAQHPAQATCSLRSVFDRLSVGAPVWFDDGHAGGVVEHVDSEGAVVTLTHARAKGVKLRPDKGLNFPETELGVAALTQKDLADLDFIASHADMIGYSFVQSAADITHLQRALRERIGEKSQQVGLVAKIETPLALRKLPEIILQAAGNQPFGVMIARGDLGVELGFERLAEIQEEMLWLCEAAHVPVIWATEVLSNLIKKGMPTRGEMTDAAMSARAECVMLNKGPYVLEALTSLDTLFVRMAEHQFKKTPRLRALTSW